MTHFSGWAKLSVPIVCGLALLTVVAGAGGAPTGPQLSPLQKRSQAVAIRYWSQYPDKAPQALRGSFQQLHDLSPSAATQPLAPDAFISQVRFNKDTQGLPQNEESVAVCRSNTNLVLGGTNDYRGLVSVTGDFGGWHYSNNGGAGVLKEGQLPSVTIAGKVTPSGGDPVVAYNDTNCDAFATNIDFRLLPDGSTETSGIVLYKTTKATLGGCSGSAACWPSANRKIVDSTVVPTNFLDKEWMDVGDSGGKVFVWVTWTEFSGNSSKIKAARCDAATLACLAPITISDPADSDFVTGNKFTQFSYVEIGENGRVYISYVSVEINPSTDAQTFTVKLKSIAPGGDGTGGTLSPATTVATLPKAIPFGGFLHAEDFRVATVPKLAVRKVSATTDKVMVVYEDCTDLLFTNICEEPKVSMRFANVTVASGAVGAFTTKLMSLSGDNYFPTVSNDRAGGKVAVAYYTNRFDAFHHRYDVELVTFDPVTNLIGSRQNETAGSGSNEPDADPILGGTFIGDYFQVFAHNGTAYTHFNANYTKLKLLGLGSAINQQDNYLNKSSF